MSGLTVLNEYTQTYITNLGCIVLVAFCIIVAFACFAALVTIIRQKYSFKKYFWLVPLLLISCIGIYVSNSYVNYRDIYYYECLIDDSVSFNEFYEKYDVVKVEGKIYTITERDTNNE